MLGRWRVKSRIEGVYESLIYLNTGGQIGYLPVGCEKSHSTMTGNILVYSLALPFAVGALQAVVLASMASWLVSATFGFLLTTVSTRSADPATASKVVG
jgi:hypothetical protein